jgi:hypothetical protein
MMSIENFNRKSKWCWIICQNKIYPIKHSKWYRLLFNIHVHISCLSLYWLIHIICSINLLISSNNDYTYTFNNPNAMNCYCLDFFFSFSFYLVIILNDDIYQLNWSIHSFFLFCIYLFHVYIVTRLILYLYRYWALSD